MALATWQIVDEIGDRVGIRKTELLARIGIAPSEYWQMRSKSMFVDREFLGKLTKSVSLNPADLPRKFHQVFEASPVIPHEYREPATVSVGLIQDIIEWVEMMNPAITADVLESLQLDERFLSLPTWVRVNTFLQVNLLDVLSARYGWHTDMLCGLGARTYFKYRNTAVGDEISKGRTTKECVEIAFGSVIENFDTNHDYSIRRVDDRSCVLRATVREQAKSLMKRKVIGSKLACWARICRCTVVPRFGGHRPYSRVRELKCIHDGDAFCEARFSDH